MIKKTDDISTPFSLRIPGDLRDRIMRGANRANRSMSAEIVYRLMQAYNTADETGGKGRQKSG